MHMHMHTGKRLRMRRIRLGALVALSAVGLAGCLGPGIHPVGPVDAPGASAGLWRSAGGEGSPHGCFWLRLTPGLQQIAGGISDDGPRYVEIAATDGYFTQSGCAPFVKVDLSEPMPPPEARLRSFGAGDRLVGREIPAGVWRAPVVPHGDCRWKRLRGFGGTEAEVIEAGVSPIVVIEPDDVGFTSDYCGTWELGTGA